MGDGIAGETPGAQHHHLRLAVAATQGRGIGLAEAVDLAGAEHGVAAPAPDIVKNPGEAHPGLVGLHEIATARTQRVGLAQQPGLRVRHHQVRVEGFHRQAGGQARDHADAGGEHFTVVAKGLRGGRDAQFREGVIEGVAACCIAHLDLVSVAPVPGRLSRWAGRGRESRRGPRHCAGSPARKHPGTDPGRPRCQPPPRWRCRP